MTNAVSSTVTRTQTSSRSSHGSNDLSDNGEAKGDRFRDLLSKLTAIAGSDGKGARAAQQGEAQPEPGHPAAGWRLQREMARGGAVGVPGSDPAAAQLPVPESAARAQGEAGAQASVASSEETAANPSISAQVLGAAEVIDSVDADDDTTPAQEHPSDVLTDMPEPGSDTSVLPPLERGQTISPATSSQPGGTGSPIVVITTAAAEVKSEVSVAVASSGEGPRKATPTPTKPAQESTSVPHGESDAIGSARTWHSADQAKAAPETGKVVTQAEDVPPMRETKLAVLRSETHFAPVPQPAPMLQIAERIKSEIGPAPAFASTRAGSGSTYAQPSSEPVLKILHIHLQPAELGAVIVRMSLKDDALELRLDVSQQATAHVIQKDHETLSTALRSAGYLVDGVTVQVVEPDRTQAASTASNPQGAQTSLQSSAQSASGGTHANAGSGRGQTSARGQDGPSSTQHDAGRGSSGPGAGGVGVYV